MIVNKEIIKKLRKITINGDSTQAEIAEYCGTGQSNISRLFKYGECSEAVYHRILEFIPKMDAKIAKRKEREQKILNRE